SQRAPLPLHVPVAERDVEQDVARRRPAHCLEAESEPAVLLLVALEALRRHGVGEGEEADLGAPEDAELRLQGLVLAIEHREEAVTRDVPRAWPVALVAEGLVVRADRLGDGAGGSAYPEEPVGDLLPGPDLGEGPVLARIEVELERLAVGDRRGVGTLAG